MIPKIIHYCWFGRNPKPHLVQKCVESWKKYCPDYEIKEWNEGNFDYSQCQYAAEAYREKKWGFVSDFVRLKVIYDFGGIYLDTDVELLKSLDSLLNEKAVLGFENHSEVNTGLIIMSEAKNTIIKSMYEIYYEKKFYNIDGTLNLISCPKYNTQVLAGFGLQQNNTKQTITDGISQVAVFPTEYFCPKDFESGDCILSENTYAIHHYSASWTSEAQKDYDTKRKTYYKRYGRSIGKFLSLFAFIEWQIKDNGFKGFCRKILRKLNRTRGI